MRALSLLVLIVAAVFLRYPYIGKDMPYFYNEDEAHHFNRAVEMVKTGSFDPNYFHKPSFHFYLRMPVVAVTFLWEVSRGNIRSVQEIVTKNPAGVGGYAFDTSHPGIAKGNRAFSVLLSVATVLLVYLIAKGCELSPLGAFTAAFITAISPALVAESATIGVDVVVVFLCVVTTLLSILSVQSRDGKGLFIAAFTAGLAVSTKYNALPIIVTPITAALFGFSGLGGAVAAIVISIIGFFIASPFIFKHIPLFLDQFAYEIWHYKIAGHEGHTAEPGLSQLWFYTNWIGTEAIGWVVIGFALIGMLLAVRSKVAAVLVSFPLLYLLLMINQKANFTRNILVLVPYFVLLATFAAQRLFSRARLLLAISFVALIVSLAPIVYRHSFPVAVTESRNDLSSFIENQKLVGIAADESLQLSAVQRNQLRIDLLPEATSPELAALSGYNYLIRPGISTDPVLLRTGNQKTGVRIVRNPALELISLKGAIDSPETKRLSENIIPTIQLTPSQGDTFECRKGTEDYCWLSTVISKVSIPLITDAPHFSGRDGMVAVKLEIMSPWEQSPLKISFSDFLADIDLGSLPSGVWEAKEIKLPYTELKDEKAFYLSNITVRSPSTEKISSDARRLGIAIRGLEVLH